MTTKENILSFLASKKEDFLMDFQVVKLGLFGSYARNEQHENSDIDIMIEFAPQTENLSQKKASIKSLIQQQFNTKVDLCREKYLKPYFKNQILKNTIYV